MSALDGFQSPTGGASVADVAVVGAGPAGLAAAIAAAETGLSVALIDERPVAGGQYLLPADSLPGGDGRRLPSTPAERLGADLLRRIEKSNVEWLPGTAVWGLDRTLALGLYAKGRASLLRAHAVVLACGAREYVIPFPGWTLPGVMTAGSAQLLAKRHGVVPGKRLLVAGSGPLLLATAAKLVALGTQVIGILEAARPISWLPYAGAVWGQGARLAEGWQLLNAVRRGRVPYRPGQAVVAATGQERVQAVTVARLDASGHPRPEHREEIAVDALCVSFGFVPNTELAQLAGACLFFDPRRGGWAPEVDASLQTSVPGLFAAGEAAAVAGASAAILAGRLAGLAASRHLGSISPQAFERAQASLDSQRRREARLGITLNALFAPPPGLDDITTSETLVCRCEEVTARDVSAAIAGSSGPVTLDSLKIWTRVGQGPCQGRTCAPALGRLIARETARPIAEAGVFSARPPVRPLPLRALAGLESTGAGAAQ